MNWALIDLQILIKNMPICDSFYPENRKHYLECAVWAISGNFYLMPFVCLHQARAGGDVSHSRAEVVSKLQVAANQVE